jgi:hypothetical protein
MSKGTNYSVEELVATGGACHSNNKDRFVDIAYLTTQLAFFK